MLSRVITPRVHLERRRRHEGSGGLRADSGEEHLLGICPLQPVNESGLPFPGGGSEWESTVVMNCSPSYVTR